MKMSRRSLFAALAGSLALGAARPAKACAHEWLCVGVIGRTEHYHHVCRHCRLQKIEVHNVWVGDKTREGAWSIPQYRRAFGYEPDRARIRRRIAQVLAVAA